MVLNLHSRGRASLDRREVRSISKENQYGNGHILHHDIQNLATRDSNERFERWFKSKGCIEKDSKLTPSVMKDLSCSRCFDAPSPVMLITFFTNLLCRRQSVRKYQLSNHRLKGRSIVLKCKPYIVLSLSLDLSRCTI